ncbi:MAG: flagellar basal body L-ring protein FlgH [Candidatus Marinimicrobia bacterium]|nr:flagellar basal body L-ring protein FlgH [Candidatus Neomarinimicrobiota bacterium]
MQTRQIILIGLLWVASIQAQSMSSMYTDIKAHSIGDVVTVLIVENASAKQESNAKSRSNAAVNADGKLAGTFANFLPVFGATSVISSDVDKTNGSRQEDRLTGKITATIIEKTDAGLLKIRGERSVEVNGEANIMKLEGSVRARDIRTDNTVFSYNIADAQIVYRQSGVINSIASPATVSKTIAISMVVVLLGLAVSGAGI